MYSEKKLYKSCRPHIVYNCKQSVYTKVYAFDLLKLIQKLEETMPDLPAKSNYLNREHKDKTLYIH